MQLLQLTWGVITALALFCEALPSENPLNRRDANDTLGLYAFGSHITQLPVFYADGKSFYLQSAFNGSEILC